MGGEVEIEIAIGVFGDAEAPVYVLELHVEIEAVVRVDRPIPKRSNYAVSLVVENLITVNIDKKLRFYKVAERRV